MYRRTLKRFGMVAVPFFLFGCSVSQVERDFPRPDMMINFDDGSAAFNNRYQLNDMLTAKASNDELAENMVFVASANSSDEYDLAVARMYAVISALDKVTDYRLLVKHADRIEQKNRLSIYRISDWDHPTKQFMLDTDITAVNGAPRLFRSSDKRLFIVRPTKRHIHSDYQNPFNQINDILSQLGWHLDSLPEDKLDKRIGSLEIVTLEETASSSEITLLMRDLTRTILDGYSFQVAADSHAVRLTKIPDGTAL